MIIVLHNVLFRKQVVKLQLFLETTITKRPKVPKSNFLSLHAEQKRPKREQLRPSFKSLWLAHKECATRKGTHSLCDVMMIVAYCLFDVE